MPRMGRCGVFDGGCGCGSCSVVFGTALVRSSWWGLCRFERSSVFVVTCISEQLSLVLDWYGYGFSFLVKQSNNRSGHFICKHDLNNVQNGLTYSWHKLIFYIYIYSINHVPLNLPHYCKTHTHTKQQTFLVWGRKNILPHQSEMNKMDWKCKST